MTSSLQDLKVYTTHPHRCSYLDDQDATTLFVDPLQAVDRDLYSQLSVLGFRRSGKHLYRPHCSNCQACIPARVPTESFEPNRTQRRALNRNRDLVIEPSDDINDDAAFELYRNYIELRHSDGDMYPANREQYEAFLCDAWNCTHYYRFYDQGKLIAIAVVDELADGLSAIYTFFDPAAHKRSIGRFAILWQVERAKALGLKYVYLGYWIRECQKMAYKAEYRPLELHVDGRWILLT